MKKADTPDTPPPRKKMPVEVFVKIWKGEMEVKGTEWEKSVKFGKNRDDEAELEFFNIEIEKDVSVKGIRNLLLHLVLKNCYLTDCEIEDSRIKSVFIKDNTTTGNFVVSDSETGDFLIQNSETKDFRVLENSTIGDFFIWEKSTTQNFLIEKSTMGDFQVLGDSIVGNVQILEESAIKNFLIEGSTIGGFTIRKSQAKEVSIENSATGNFQVLENSIIMMDFLIKKSQTGEFLIVGSETRDFLIRENSQTGDFRVQEGSQTRNYEIRNSTIRDFWVKNSKAADISLYENSQTGDFWIQEGSQTRDFWIENSTTRDFWIEDSISGSFKVSKNSTIGDFRVLKNSKMGNFLIENSKAADYRINDSASGNFEMYRVQALALLVDGRSKLTKVSIKYTTLQKIEILEGSFINSLTCHFNLQEPIHLLLKQSIFDYLDFNDSVFPESTTLSILDCAVNHLKLNNFCNYGTIFFSRLKPLQTWKDFKESKYKQAYFVEGGYQFEVKDDLPSTLRLTDSDLGKMQFINCDLLQFKRFEFSNTKMLEVFVAGSYMPDYEAFCLPNDEKDPLEIAEQKRLAYGQFKKIYEARGDVAGSLPYLAYEMNAYLDELDEKSKNWRDHFGERWMLRLNRYSTNYGNNWLLGAKRTFWAIVICYSLFCLSHGFFPGTDVARFLEVASYAPQYLNPFRDADTVIPEAILPELPDWWKKWILPFSRLIDYASRIIVAYFVYQTIQAFRKLGKSSG